MKYLTSGLTRALALAALFVVFSASELAHAATTPSPAVAKGLSWLQAQVQAAGSLTNEAASIATPLQNRAESLQTFKLLATVPGPLADQLAADTQNNTEYQARRAMELNLAGRDASAITSQLLARQNPDGGFSGDAGYGSDPLDTAWVMLALAQNNLATTTAAQSARSYLLGAIQADGGVGTGSDSARINASALSLLALQMFPQDLTSATALKQISSWLLLKQGADGSWLGNSNLTALALAAVSPLISDPTISTTATSYLAALQGADGSWGGGDPFLTSVVLRALSGGTPATSAANSAITGLVVDQATTTPLAGATVTLSGASTATFTTASDGKINFANLPAGSYTLQITSAGYSAYTGTYQLNTSQTLNVGTIALTQVLTSGIVTGTVTDGATGLALAGATVQVNAASAVTDANGGYKLSGVTPGPVTLSASAVGYATATATGNVTSGQTLTFSPALYTASTAAAPRTGTYTGKVVAVGTGLPLAGVSIVLNGTAMGVTAADGSFNLVLAPTSYTAAFTLAGYNSAAASFMLTAGTTVSQGTVTLTQIPTTGTVSGTVTNAATGLPLAGATVAINGTMNVLTDANGLYQFTSVAPGTVTLSASMGGYTAATGTGNVLAGQTLTFSPALYASSVAVPTTGTYTGKVVSAGTGLPLGGVGIQLNGAPAGVTAADGSFTLVQVPASYTATFNLAGYNSATSTFLLTAGTTVNAGTVTLLQLPTTGTVSGKVTSASTGLPLAGATVTLNGGTSAMTDANGVYQFASVAPGNITLSANLSGYASAAGTGSLLAGQTMVFSPALSAATVAPTTGTFTGKVVAAGTGLPLAGVSIQLNGAAAGTTAADGGFSLILPPASYAGAFSLAGYNTATSTFLLTAGTTINAGTVALTPQVTTTTISGVVKDATTGNPINAAQVQLVNGPVVSTGTSGAYMLSGLTGATFDLRVSAMGYVSQSLQLMVPQPMNVAQDFSLQAQTGSGLSLGTLMVNPGNAGSGVDIGISTILSNATTGAAASVVLTMQIVNAAGKVVSTAAAYDKTGANMLGSFTVNPGQQVPVLFRWNTMQFPPGAYSLVARVVAAGTINQATPLGKVLTSGQASATITPSQHFTGAVSANPPVLQAGTNTPVQLTATLANDGNTDLPAQLYQLTLINQATSAVVATQQVSGGAFSPNALQTLTFANWTPAAGGGNFTVEVQAVSSPALGGATGAVYVGDAATGTFTVGQIAVTAGTQTIKGNIHVTGQSTTQSVLSDSVTPLIKLAIQRAVAYNDAGASAWTLQHPCLGCHIQAQALVGGEMTRSLTTYNVAQRNIVFNALTIGQNSDGSIDTIGSDFWKPMETMLGLWALNSSHNSTEFVSSLTRAADYLVQNQQADGSWYTYYTQGWWTSPFSYTGFDVKNVIGVRQTLAQSPVGSARNYALAPWAPGSAMPGAYKTTLADATGNIYVAACNAGTVSLVRPDGTVQQLMSGLTYPYQMAFGADGSLYVATYGNGLLRRAPNGAVSNVTPQRGTGLIMAPDGNLYMTSAWDNAVYQITPQGVTTTYISGGALSVPYGIAATATGELLVVNMLNRKILKFRADKTYEEVVSWTGGSDAYPEFPYYLLQDGTGWLLGTTKGLSRYNSDWQGERLISGQFVWSLSRMQNGQVLAGDANNLYTLQDTPMNVASELAKLDGAIGKGVNWLLSADASASGNLSLAHQLIGLGEASRFYAGTPLVATIQTKMAGIGAQLRQQQLPDGGWRGPCMLAVGCPPGSDSMVTAQVGMALDYLNPTASDPVVQNAVKMLLSRQQPDGSWISEDGILTTNLSATTWVAIYLPIALNRIGGINTDLTLSMPANVTLANPSMAPASRVANTAGGTDYLWHLQGVKSAGVDVGFDLTLQNMALGETRPVASNAYLTFNNTFTNQPAIGPISVPRVTASAFLGVGVTTDQVSYGANAPVNITAAVNNTSAAGLLDGSVRLEIYAADNSLVSVVGTPLPFTALAAGAQTSLGGTWNTGTLAAGSYYVLASLYDAQNRLAGTAKSAFTLTAGIGSGAQPFTGVGAAVTVDKQSYQPYDRVQIASRISNLTQNLAFSGLQAVITVNRPDGSVLYTQSAPLQQLLAAAFIDLPSSTQLASAPAGQYPVTLSVQNASAVELARATTGFTVLSTANTGNGLKGTVGALPKIVPQTDSVILSWTAGNLGNADFAALPVKLTVIDPVTLQAMTQQTYTIPLAQGQSYQTAFSWDTSPATVGSTYIAVLAVTVSGKDIVLAQDAFLVTDPPVRLGVTQSTLRENRVLVWLACAAGQDPNSATPQDTAHASDGAQTAAFAQGKTNADSKGQGDNKAHDGQDKPEGIPLCLQTRSAFLQSLLGGLNLPYLITTKRDGFRNAFREGRYNVYWLSGDINLSEGDAKQSDKARQSDSQGSNAPRNDGRTHPEDTPENLLQEIREAVYRGDSLIQDGPKHGDFLQETAGLSYADQLPGINLALNTSGLLFPAQPLPSDGRALGLRTVTGTAQATFVIPANGDDRQHQSVADSAQQNSDNAAKAGDQSNAQQANGKQSGNNGQSNNGQGNDAQNQDPQASPHPTDDAHKPAPVWPAIVNNEYGRGHALTFGFDLVDTLQNSAAPAAWSILLQTGFTWLLPPQPSPYSGGAYVRLDTDIQNLARSVDLAVASVLPPGATLLQTAPLATLDATGQPNWLFTLPQAATQTLLIDLRLPFASGNQTALTTIDSLRNGKTRRYGSYNYAWQVAASDTLAAKLIIDLNALTLSRDDEIEARAAALAQLQQATNAIGQARYGAAIQALLGAVDQVRKITSVDTRAIRLNLDSMLQETEWNWLRTGGATAAPASTPDHADAQTQDAAHASDAQQPTQAAHK